MAQVCDIILVAALTAATAPRYIYITVASIGSARARICGQSGRARSRVARSISGSSWRCHRCVCGACD
eukprot:2663590-Lingulodinium_polyedra.AAC.1